MGTEVDDSFVTAGAAVTISGPVTYEVENGLAALRPPMLAPETYVAGAAVTLKPGLLTLENAAPPYGMLVAVVMGAAVLVNGTDVAVTGRIPDEYWPTTPVLMEEIPAKPVPATGTPDKDDISNGHLLRLLAIPAITLHPSICVQMA
mmetsp:Transcript_19697/g.45752  ORF Transcript_19697/g.45752 Transcript_19697/m.45752 type:complete len:147 (+) Transcript_19697:754-1194(+)